MNNLFLFWIILAIIFLIIEILTPGIFFFACLSIAAVFTGIISFFIFNKLILWTIFTVISVLIIYFIKPVIKKIIKYEERKSNIDEIIGKHAILIETIDFSKGMGMVKVNGELWRAKSDEVIEKNDNNTFVEITGVEGTYLNVRRIK